MNIFFAVEIRDSEQSIVFIMNAIAVLVSTNTYYVNSASKNSINNMDCHLK